MFSLCANSSVFCVSSVVAIFYMPMRFSVMPTQKKETSEKGERKRAKICLKRTAAGQGILTKPRSLWTRTATRIKSMILQ
jgi:hypothetical protein